MWNNNFYPYYNSGMKLSGLRKLSFASMLDKTQKTLNVINQAIPVFYQIKPLYDNAKTALKVMSAIKDEPSSKEKIKSPKKEEQKVKETKKEKKVVQEEIKKERLNNSPTYFL